MRANRIHRFGGPEVIVFEEVAQPLPGDGEVLVRVKAAGVGNWDALVRDGKSGLLQPLPLTLGAEYSGVVESIGAGVRGFAHGDQVFGATNALFIGAYAEYVVAAVGMVAPAPRSLSAVEAASVPVVAVTAWQMLFDHAHLSAGQTVLVHGAAGNVGAYAVQLAKRRGARVIAAAVTEDLDELRRLGADETIDVRAVHFEDAAGPVDVVIDTVGGSVQNRSLAILDRGGILVSCVSPPDKKEAEQHGVRATFFIVEITHADLVRIATLIDAGELRARVGAVLPLGDAKKAHQMMAGPRPHPRGKIVLSA